MNDAFKYYSQLNEANPNDPQILLRLGWTLNQLHNDREAIRYFDRARLSPDANVAAEAQRAYDNLRPQFETVRTSAWMLPFYSSRWKDTFAYGQFKTEIRIPGLRFLKPYASLRLIGDLPRFHQPPRRGLPPVPLRIRRHPRRRHCYPRLQRRHGLGRSRLRHELSHPSQLTGPAPSRLSRRHLLLPRLRPPARCQVRRYLL